MSGRLQGLLSLPADSPVYDKAAGRLATPGAVPEGKGGASLDEPAANAYRRLLETSDLYSPEEAATMRNRGGDTIARGAEDAIQQARLDAIRRGVPTATTADAESRIRLQSAAAQQRAAQDFDTGLRQQSYENLLGAASGAGGYGIGRGQLELSQELGRGGLNLSRDRFGLEQELGRGGLDVSRGHLGIAGGQLGVSRLGAASGFLSDRERAEIERQKWAFLQGQAERGELELTPAQMAAFGLGG